MRSLTKKHDSFIEYLWDQVSDDLKEEQVSQLSQRIVNRWVCALS